MLVGRERELVQLRGRLGRGETVAFLGEAGVGKTALLREAVARSGRRLYEGGGLATLSWLPYLPLERALQRKLAGGDEAWVAGEVEREVGDGVLLLDDLHWADSETRALLSLLHGRIALLTAVRRGGTPAPRAPSRSSPRSGSSRSSSSRSTRRREPRSSAACARSSPGQLRHA
jgi:hypothetical protein